MEQQKRGLGRGLDALIPPAPEPAPEPEPEPESEPAPDFRSFVEAGVLHDHPEWRDAGYRAALAEADTAGPVQSLPSYASCIPLVTAEDITRWLDRKDDRAWLVTCGILSESHPHVPDMFVVPELEEAVR